MRFNKKYAFLGFVGIAIIANSILLPFFLIKKSSKAQASGLDRIDENFIKKNDGINVDEKKLPTEIQIPQWNNREINGVTFNYEKKENLIDDDYIANNNEGTIIYKIIAKVGDKEKKITVSYNKLFQTSSQRKETENNDVLFVKNEIEKISGKIIILPILQGTIDENKDKIIQQLKNKLPKDLNLKGVQISIRNSSTPITKGGIKITILLKKGLSDEHKINNYYVKLSLSEAERNEILKTQLMQKIKNKTLILDSLNDYDLSNPTHKKIILNSIQENNKLTNEEKSKISFNSNGLINKQSYKDVGVKIVYGKAKGDLAFKVKRTEINLPNDINDIKLLGSINLREIPYNNSGSNKYYLGKLGLLKLKKRIENELSYGPEIFFLNDIIIGEPGIENTQADGTYHMNGHRRIYLSRNWIDRLNKKHNDIYKKVDQNSTNENEFLDTKVDIIFQVLYHEYGHHFDNMYLRRYKIKKTKDATIDINAVLDFKTTTVGEDKKTVNKHFYEQFKMALNYDKKWEDVNKDVPRPSVVKKNNTDYYPVSHFIDQKVIFNFTNSTKGRKEMVDIVTPIQDKNIISSAFNIESEYKLWIHLLQFRFGYLFSFSELVARKYQLLNMPFIGNEITNYNKDGYYTHNDISLEKSQFLRDVLRYQDKLQIKSIRERFLLDSPFEFNKINGKRSIQFYNAFSKIMGHLDKNDLTIMSNLYENNKLSKDYMRLAGYIKNDNFNNLFGSEKIDNAKGKQAYLGIMENGSFKPVKSIYIYNYNFRRKSHLTSNSRVGLESNQAKYFWVVNDGDKNSYNFSNSTFDKGDYLNVSQLQSKHLYIAKNSTGSNAYKLKKYMGSNKAVDYNSINKTISNYTSDSTSYAPVSKIYSVEKNGDAFVISKK